MVEFKSKIGNNYFWDNDSRLIIPYPKLLKLIREICDNKGYIPQNSMLNELNKYYDNDEIIFYYNWFKKWNKIQLPSIKSYSNHSPAYIKKFVQKTGLKSLILTVTEDCNLRCKYCAYSGNYVYRREHSKKYMSFEVAKKAIDYYFSQVNQGIKYNPFKKVLVTFYGGEPLLNFNLIKKCVSYINTNYDNIDLDYSITTNGTLLSEKIIQWLLEHDFYLHISLDGPEEEHDRCRVYENGKGTFNDVMKKSHWFQCMILKVTCLIWKNFLAMKNYQ